MGFSPEQIGRMSVWEFLACRDGWNRAHGGAQGDADADAMSPERMRDLGLI